MGSGAFTELKLFKCQKRGYNPVFDSSELKGPREGLKTGLSGAFQQFCKIRLMRATGPEDRRANPVERRETPDDPVSYRRKAPL